MIRNPAQLKQYRRATRTVAGESAWLAFRDMRDPVTRRTFTPDDLAPVDEPTPVFWLEPHESPYC